ncbi:MAG TPA: hypothetical protein VHN19_04695 [Burkholderiales bacterium]|jgi:hypothetical protein|nr:hypothetical protein [Burkholderiales bacterium]
MGTLAKALEGIKLPKEADALVAEADRLLEQRPKEASYIQELESQIKRLRDEKGIPGAIGNLVWNDKRGIYESPDGKGKYCPACISKNKRAPLKVEQFGWRCMAAGCGKYFEDPDNPEEPPIITMA